MRKIGPAGLSLIKQWEGLKLDAYQDVAGIWTIGYGSTGDHVRPGMRITEPEAEELLLSDMMRFEHGVDTGVTRSPTQNQFDAMVSLAFNIGTGGFAGSTVLRRFNAGDDVGAADAILMWNKARVNGQLREVQGLTNRRRAERELFLTPPGRDVRRTHAGTAY